MKKLVLVLTFALGLAFAIAASPAGATPPDNRPPDNRPPERGTNQGGEAEADAQADASATAQGGDAASSSSLDGSNNSTTSTSNDTDFFSLATTFPQVSGCFKGRQGGAGGAGGGIWFGGHGLDLNCFLTSIAEAEPDIEVSARLKCGSKAFRNAISFEVKSRDRQVHCVNYMTLKHRNELSALRERAEFLLIERNRIERELIERNKLVIAQCAEKLERSEEAWLECLAK